MLCLKAATEGGADSELRDHWCLDEGGSAHHEIKHFHWAAAAVTPLRCFCGNAPQSLSSYWKPSRNHRSLFAARRHRREVIYTSLAHHTSSEERSWRLPCRVWGWEQKSRQIKRGAIDWGHLLIDSACNVSASWLLPLRSAACWETGREEARMQLAGASHSVSTVITAPHQRQALFQFCIQPTASTSISWPFCCSCG